MQTQKIFTIVRIIAIIGVAHQLSNSCVSSTILAQENPLEKKLIKEQQDLEALKNEAKTNFPTSVEANEKFKIGLYSIREVTDVQASFDLVQTKVIENKNDYRLSKENLSTLTGSYNDVFSSLPS